MRLGILPALIAAAALAVAPAARAQRLAGATPAPGTVEEGFWDLSGKTERAARNSAELNRDPALNAYVREVTCKVAVEYCGDVRVYVMDRPFFNASMAPNGYTEVWSGALLRAGSEAELAFILAHEVSHFERNHTLESWQRVKNTSDAMLALSIGLAVAGAAAAANTGSYQTAQSIIDATRGLIDVTYLVAVASFFRFSRAQESEADSLGLARMQKAGYPAPAAPVIWRTIMDETQRSEFERVRRAGGRTNIFDSHPVAADRIEALRARLSALPAGGDEGRARHRAAIRPHLAAWLKDDLRRRDYGQTLFLLERLAEGGEDLGMVNFYRGEAYRLRRREGDEVLAANAYATAAVHPDSPVEAWRELGDLRRKAGDPAAARTAYESYLARAPQAEDAWLVQDSLKSLGGL